MRVWMQGGDSTYFTWVNRGKESLVADIKAPRDRQLLLNILKEADVFVQNLAPGAAARAGLGSDHLRKVNKRLVTMDISGYGEFGPKADYKVKSQLQLQPCKLQFLFVGLTVSSFRNHVHGYVTGIRHAGAG